MKQKKVVHRIIENHGNISKSMREVGYSENTAINPKNLTESKGFKEICNNIGLTDDFIAKCLQEDIEGKPLNRKPELELASKLKGLLVEKKEITAKISLSDILDDCDE